MGKPSKLKEIDAHIADLLEVYKELKKRDKREEKSLHWFFSSLPVLANSLKSNENNDYRGNKHALNIILVYLYMRLEHVQRRILRGAAIVECRTDEDITEDITEKFSMYRDDFYKAYKKIEGQGISKDTKRLIQSANRIRDGIMHGQYMNISEDKKKDAIFSVFKYAEELSKQVKGRFGFEPFGRLEDLEEINRKLNEDETTRSISKRKTIAKLKESKISLEARKKQPKCLAKCRQK